ncbi:MAG TPA: hypothetical protein VGS97_28720 [Actinocrinis sp.]|uniref:hypothetical protein n=1 Tax=Actinocrinis sp. TaxID=1920516 RepID=UPI002DDD98E6|nr:hypothetical protein [Actinocrinis sp.]HEV2348104.1 hypothetical protein [Actinocrinis sp.]
MASSDLGTHGPQLLQSLNNLVLVLRSRVLAGPADLLDAIVEARALAERLADRDPSARVDVAPTLLRFAEARVLVGQDLDAANAAVGTLLSVYGAEASAAGLIDRATALREQLAQLSVPTQPRACA